MVAGLDLRLVGLSFEKWSLLCINIIVQGRLQYLSILHLLDWSRGSCLPYFLPCHEQVFFRYFRLAMACFQPRSDGMVGCMTPVYLSNTSNKSSVSGTEFKAGSAANASTS